MLFLVYAIITFLTVLNHEVWSDEAQAWVLTRDTNLIELIKLVRIEGHPLLWYLLILPFTKLINSFNAIMGMQILNWLLVIIGMGFFVFKAPFNNITKFSVLFSSGILYWYPVVARSYCLIPILLFLLAVLYEKQKEHPFWYVGLLILLANTHSIMFGFCATLGFVFACNCFKTKNKTNYIAVAIGVISAIIIISYLWGSWNENLTVKTIPHITGLAGFSIAFDELTKNIYGYSNLLCYILLSVFLLFFSILFFVKNKKIFFIYISNLLYQFLIYIFCWGVIPHRAYTLILVTIFCVWSIKDIFKEKTLRIITNLIFTVVLFFSVQNGLQHCLRDIFFEHSGGKSTAKYIIEHIPENAFIIVNEPFMSVSISAYIPKNKTKWKFFSQEYNNYYTYTNYKDSKAMKNFYIYDLEKYIETTKEIYVILSRSFFHDLKPIWQSKEEVHSHEIFKIYKLSNN